MLRPSHSVPPLSKARSEFCDGSEEPAREARLPSAVLGALDQHVGVACTDRTGVITFVNAAYCSASGYAPSELLGQTHRLLSSAHHPPDFFAELWRTISRGDVWRGEIMNRTKAGQDYWIAASIAPVAGAGASSYVALCTDITRLKCETLAERERHQRELMRRDEELRQYAYAASHDLQEPLRAIVSCGQLLRRECAAAVTDATARQLLEHMIEGGERLQRLLRALLDYSRVASHADRHVLSSSRAALDQARQRLDALAREAEASFEVGELPAVHCDPHQLAHVFEQLLDNAIKYRSARPLVIRVSAAREGDDFRFSVADNGMGIDRQQLDRVFVLFQRLHARSKYPGSGIGLTICRKIVERHGGAIWAESGQGDGATFHFTLPAQRSSRVDES